MAPAIFLTHIFSDTLFWGWRTHFFSKKHWKSNERKYLYCSAQAIENELHYLTECPLYLMEWKELFKVIIKGIVHLNIIFSYMKVNKICNLDHPVY